MTAILVYSLQNLVTGRVAETGEEGEKLPAERLGRLVLEDDLVELGKTGHLMTVS